MTRSAPHDLARIAAVALAVAAAAACSPLEAGIGAASLAGPQAATGRNTFYLVDKYFGRSCSDVSYFDRPVRCVNDPG